MLSSGEMTSTSPRLSVFTRLADVDALARRFSSFTATWTATPGGRTSRVPIAGLGDGPVLGLGARLGAAEELGPSVGICDPDGSGDPVAGAVVDVGPEQALMSTMSDATMSLRMWRTLPGGAMRERL